VVKGNKQRSRDTYSYAGPTWKEYLFAEELAQWRDALQRRRFPNISRVKPDEEKDQSHFASVLEVTIRALPLSRFLLAWLLSISHQEIQNLV
jgi:hypothetical protein